MKIAVTSQDRKTITGHAGHCRRFWIYECDDKTVVNKTLLELTMEQTFHATHGAVSHPLDGIDALITAGMGAGLVRRLTSKGLQPLVTSEADPDSAVANFLRGTLKVAGPALGEAHGEHHDGCGCGH